MTDDIKQKIAYYQAQEQDPYFVQDLARVLAAGDEKEITERFYTELEFGTGGIRGIIGAGVNRLNTLVVRTVATGWAQYLQAAHKTDAEISVVIAYDSRRFSAEFSNAVSRILCGCGIRVYAFTAPRPTPQLSLAIRQLGAQSGMVITASHNPPQYNGLKIYGRDGAQLVSPEDTKLMEYITAATPLPLGAELASFSNYTPLDAAYDEHFYAYVRRVLNFGGGPVGATAAAEPAAADNYSVVYTPLHGTGAVHIEKLAKEAGIKCIIEPTQKEPDGNFPTLSYPNPEDPKALTNAIKTAAAAGASLVIANDPDADRMGVAERSEAGDFTCITGNQIGVLLLDYLISRLASNNKDAAKDALKDASGYAFVNTIVTTTLQEKIARAHGMQTFCGYTGFKNIAQFMRAIETHGTKKFLFGCEESYGYLASDEIRDKDGISIALLFMQMARAYAGRGLSLEQKLRDIYRVHGYHEERAVSKTIEGREGKERIQSIMRMLREKTPARIGEEKIVQTHDYLSSTVTRAGKATKDESLPPADVLIFETEGGNKVCVRPSGTEPKIKFYLLYCSAPGEDYDAAVSLVQQLLSAAERDVARWLEA